MEGTTIPTSTNPEARLSNLPEELIVYLLQFTDDCGKFALSRAGSEKLYRIARYELLRTSSRTRNSALSWACCNGDETLLRTVIEFGADVNHVFTGPNPCGTRHESSPRTPLNLSIGHEQVDIVQLLLEEYHADVDLQDPYGGLRPLEWALSPIVGRELQVYFTGLLLDYGVENHQHYFPWFIDRSPEIRIFHNDLIPINLLRRTIATNTTTNHAAYEAQYKFCISSLNQPEVGTFTRNQLEKLRILRDAATMLGNSRQRLVCGRFELLSDIFTARMLNTGWRYRIQNCFQWLAIELVDYPAINEVVPVYETTVWNFLINQLYEKLPYSHKGYKAMISCLQMLLDAGADPIQSYDAERKYNFTRTKYRRFEGNGRWGLRTPLSGICATEIPIGAEADRVIDFLVQAGEPIDAQDRGGLQALHFASKYLQSHIVKRLIRYGANVNAVDAYGSTALHLVTYQSDIFPKIIYLLNSRAHVGIRRRSRIVSMLLNHGADPSIADNYGRTPLHLSCRYGSLEVVLLLVADPRVDINAEARDLGTPLHYLSRLCELSDVGRIGKYDLELTEPRIEDRVKIAEILINAGADVRALDGDNWMPIVYARRYGCVELVNVLLAHGGDDGFGLGKDEYGGSIF